MGLFERTPEHLKKKLNLSNARNGVKGEGSNLSDSDLLEILDDYDDMVQGRVPGRVYSLLRHVDGEILTAKATGDETSLQLGLAPVSNVKIYHVHNLSLWQMVLESDLLTEGTDYTVNLTTGAVTLIDTPLTEGYTVIANYDHTAAAQFRTLARIVVDLAAVEVARRLWPDDDMSQYERWETQAYSDLSRIQNRAKDGKLGIPVLDGLNLVDETRVDRMVAAPYDVNGGML